MDKDFKTIKELYLDWIESEKIYKEEIFSPFNLSTMNYKQGKLEGFLMAKNLYIVDSDDKLRICDKITFKTMKTFKL